MAKRIYFETIKQNALKYGLPTGIATFALLFWWLVVIGSIIITGYSGDMICSGTEGEPCLAYINFTANEDIFIYPIDYDPYGRETPFGTDKALKEWHIYRSWGSGWREIKLNQTCTATWCGAPPNSPNNKYAFAFRKDRDYQIKIVAYKENPSEDIKWSFGPIDPVWFGTSKESTMQTFFFDSQATKGNTVLVDTIKVQKEGIYKYVEFDVKKSLHDTLEISWEFDEKFKEDLNEMRDGKISEDEFLDKYYQKEMAELNAADLKQEIIGFDSLEEISGEDTYIDSGGTGKKTQVDLLDTNEKLYLKSDFERMKIGENSATFIGGTGIVVNGASNTLTSIDSDIGNKSIFNYTSGTAISYYDIHINKSAEFEIISETLSFNVSNTDGDIGLYVNSPETGSVNFYLNDAKINHTAGSLAYQFLIYTGASDNITIVNSDIRDAGWASSDAQQGLTIYEPVELLQGNYLKGYYAGLHLTGTADNFVTHGGNTFETEYSYGRGIDVDGAHLIIQNELIGGYTGFNAKSSAADNLTAINVSFVSVDSAFSLCFFQGMYIYNSTMVGASDESISYGAGCSAANGDDIIVYDSILEEFSIGASTDDGTRLWLINTTHNDALSSSFCASTALCSFQHYVTVTVLNGTDNSTMADVVVTFTDKDNVLRKNVTSDVNGLISKLNVSEWEEDDAVVNYLSNYTIEGILGDYIGSVSKNITENMEFNLTVYLELGPTSTLSYPADENITEGLQAVTFECNATDNLQLSNMTFYLWNSTSNIDNQTTKDLTGTDNSTTFTHTFTYYDTYEWNCLAYDNDSISEWAEANWSIQLTESELSITDPTTASPKETTDGANITLIFEYLLDGANVTSGVTLNNITIGGVQAEIVSGGAGGTFPIDFEDMEGYAEGSAPNPIGNWTQATFDTDQWLVYTGNGESSGTGPTADYDGYYAMVETSSGECNNPDTAVLYRSPAIDFDLYDVVNISFAYNMYGSTMGNLSIRENSTGSWLVEWSEAGDQGTDWFVKEVSLTGKSGTGNIAIWMACGASYTSDAAVDSVNITAYTTISEEFEWVAGSGWNVNVTVPTLGAGSYDLFINGTYNSKERTDTETNAITIGGVGNADINYTVALPLGVIRFLNCSPDFENPDSRPDGQTATISAINATNNGTAEGSFTINLTGALNTGWTIWASNDSLVNNITLNATAQTIWSGVATSETKQIWLAANCSFVSANPGQSISMWAV